MSDNVIQFPPQPPFDNMPTVASLPTDEIGNSSINVGCVPPSTLINLSGPCVSSNATYAGPIHPGSLIYHPQFGDPEQMLNMRNWLEAALVASGALINGGGMGMNEVDLDFVHEGFSYHIILGPR